MKILTVAIIICAALVLSSSASFAQKYDRFSGEASIIDTVTLKVGFRNVSLWGIKAVKSENSLIQIKTMELLESLTSAGKVSCKIVKDSFPKATARCLSSKDVDLGLELVSQGYAILDREQMDNSEFSQIYAEAQKTARTTNKGIWEYLDKQSKKEAMADMLSGYFSDTSLLIISISAVVGLLVLMFFSIIWLKRNLSHQKDEIEKLYFKEYLLKAKEKSVVISLMRGELDENKGKVESFIAFYQDMLKNIKDSDRAGSLKLLGDAVRKAPVLKKEIYELNQSKLSILDVSVTGKISRLYSQFSTDEQMDEINKKGSLDLARNILRDSIKAAKELSEEIQKTINLLDKEYAGLLEILKKSGQEADSRISNKSGNFQSK